ncbi:hypothetical protein SSBR45G_50810 [Bradyrhizobium sp. SSBR45G]|uniref:hypothetical protein n=1 Tax=unclassified Bradyrhizobium TaxID=2631580 RepID=UPI002342B8F7|nr:MULTISPECIES: hypothetical protein [unclassified Bradyrhizobium]GLH80172.1 hypothetical protein SSBR45G_50810 [Bradyrhizobium sp. SSBR45G]GLH87665.1 hypothetical protein SSBR45R_51250 [Bradyrhizobium sp. SSBR45R]
MTENRWTRGYTQTELDDAQSRFGLRFPPDLVALLRDRRPVAGHDWNDSSAIRRMLDWPLEGLFDVEHNALWWPEWGEKPDRPEAREEVLRAVLARAPKLIPLISHRYLPEQPHEAGNPVFSVYQADVIHYGVNLDDYFDREFLGWNGRPWPDRIRYIPFWSDLVARNRA